MRANLAQTVAVVLITTFLGAGPAGAQVPPPPADQAAPQSTAAQAAPQSTAAQAAPQSTAAQLDQLLAPIALYPDPLLAQILMAASYPLEVIQADRWLQDPNNATLAGDQLAAALEPQPWDPSVKSLAPFPQILFMMDRNLDWTERLGDAFAANQSAVMDSVQRLRGRAETAGKLGSTPQEAVTTADQAITIEPSNPEVLYVPVYDPTVAYGPWPYPASPPCYFPGYFDDANADGFGWFGVSIVAPLWGWHHWDWHHRRIDIDRNRFAALDRSRPPIRGDVWEHDASRRHDAPAQNPAARERFAGFSGAPAPIGPHVFHGNPVGASVAQFHPPQRGVLPQVIRPQAMPQVSNFPGRGVDVRPQFQRAPINRTSMPAFRPNEVGPRPAPSGGAGQHFAPSGGARSAPSGGGMTHR
jgi:hypothetical protein